MHGVGHDQVDADEWQQTAEEGEGGTGAKEGARGTTAGSTGGGGVTRAIRFKTPLHVRDFDPQNFCGLICGALCFKGPEKHVMGKWRIMNAVRSSHWCRFSLPGSALILA